MKRHNFIFNFFLALVSLFAFSESRAACHSISGDPLWEAQCRAAGPTRPRCSAIAECEWVVDGNCYSKNGDPLWDAQCAAIGKTRRTCEAESNCQWGP